ncbi:MAG TPA: RsmD family RNA methyltransferase, partial [Polyangiaceae bacterium]|nr:RsmD family RNA methyltransferase [Polyangiaceae bacterium]
SGRALSVLRANVSALGLERQTLVVGIDVGRATERLVARGPFDLVLADPPWALVDSGDAPRAIANLVGAGVLAAGAVVVLEHAARTAPPAIPGLAIEECRRYGDTALAVYKPAILAPPGS